MKCFVLAILLACAAAQDDPCKDAHKTEASCDADKTTGGGCVWCKCAALPSSCWTKDNAKKLPAGVYDCDSANRITMEPSIEFSESYTNWKSHAVSADAKMTVFFMMKHDQRDVKALEQKLLAVSDPRSAEYGQHLSTEELANMLPISDVALDSVMSLLDAHAVTDFSVNKYRDMVEATVTVGQANAMFRTEVRVFAHASKPVKLLRAVRPYSLPRHVAEHVSFVGDLVRLPEVRAPLRVSAAGPGKWPNSCKGEEGCAGLVQPAVLNQRYSINGSVAAEGNSMAVAEFQGQFYNPKDLEKFSSACGVNVTVDKNVGENHVGDGVEAELDIEYIKGLAPEIPLTVVYASAYSLLKYAQTLADMDSPPLVNSVSYGNDEKQQVSKEYIFSTATQFMKLGAKGLTVLFASGDQGVCGREGCGLFVRHFHPDFPAGCPYVTAVGGTDFVTYDIGAERAWAHGGGGFSDHFDIPSWQADAVSKYKSNPDADLPPARFWNNTGRGYPDVSALGGEHTPYCVVTGGRAEGVAGTSASCPVFAAVVAKLNAIRLKAKKPALGFLNPFIYQNPQAFNDVTQGMNGVSKEEAFKAVAGWDAATGMGTPNYELLAKAVEALP